MKTINVLLCDDHAIVRQGLRILLQAAEDIRVVGEAENGHQAVAETQRLRPDVVLLDLAMPLLNGVEATRQIALSAPFAKVMILSSYSDDQHVEQAIQAGAAGYVMKETAADDLLSSIREVHNGNASFSPRISRALMNQLRQGTDQASTPVPDRLTIRQMEILQLIAEGYSTKQMAGFLHLSAKTVEKHRQALMDRLDIHSIAALTRYAIFSGVADVACTPQGTPHSPNDYGAFGKGQSAPADPPSATAARPVPEPRPAGAISAEVVSMGVPPKAVTAAWNPPLPAIDGQVKILNR